MSFDPTFKYCTPSLSSYAFATDMAYRPTYLLCDVQNWHSIPSYALAMRCPVLAWHTVLRTCYEVS
eukprot:3941997-Rhodomonas_salina.2